jgi:hypothetical protein
MILASFLKLNWLYIFWTHNSIGLYVYPQMPHFRKNLNYIPVEKNHNLWVYIFYAFLQSEHDCVVLPTQLGGLHTYPLLVTTPKVTTVLTFVSTGYLCLFWGPYGVYHFLFSASPQCYDYEIHPCWGIHCHLCILKAAFEWAQICISARNMYLKVE